MKHLKDNRGGRRTNAGRPPGTEPKRGYTIRLTDAQAEKITTAHGTVQNWITKLLNL